MDIKVADQAWIATALLQREHPERPDFTLREIRERAEREFGPLKPGVWQHLVSHGVASNAPTPVSVRLLTQTERGRRRLYRPGDPVDPKRQRGKTHPDPAQVPEKYRGLIEWYERGYGSGRGGGLAPTPVGVTPKAMLAFVGLIPAYDLEVVRRKVEEDCERIEREDVQ